MRRNHPREFKLSLCERISTGELSKSGASREYGLSLGMLGRWLEQYAVHGKNSFQGQAWRAQAISSATRIEQLEEELRLSQLEVKFMQQLLDQKKSPGGRKS